jgi:hypothetical protein
MTPRNANPRNAGHQTPSAANATPAGMATIVPITNPVFASARARPRRSGGVSALTAAVPTLMKTGNKAP